MKRIKELETMGFMKTPKKGYYYIEKSGYLFIAQRLMGRKIALMTCLKETEGLNSMLDQLIIHHDIIKRVYLDEDDLGIIIKMNKTTTTDIENVLDALCDYLVQEKIPPICHICHEAHDLEAMMLDEEIEIACSECAAKAKENPKSHKSHPWLGIAGAFLLGIIPAVIWAGLHDLGYVITLDGILFMIMSYIGYLRLGSYMDKKGLILSFVMAIVMLLIGQVFAMVIEIQSAIYSYMAINTSMVQGFMLLPAFVADGTIIIVALKYLGCAIALMLATLFFCHKVYQKKHRYSYVYETVSSLNSQNLKIKN